MECNIYATNVIYIIIFYCTLCHEDETKEVMEASAEHDFHSFGLAHRSARHNGQKNTVV